VACCKLNPSVSVPKPVEAQVEDGHACTLSTSVQLPTLLMDKGPVYLPPTQHRPWEWPASGQGAEGSGLSVHHTTLGMPFPQSPLPVLTFLLCGPSVTRVKNLSSLLYKPDASPRQLGGREEERERERERKGG
jgi:hypothetical protein